MKRICVNAKSYRWQRNENKPKRISINLNDGMDAANKHTSYEHI